MSGMRENCSEKPALKSVIIVVLDNSVTSQVYTFLKSRTIKKYFQGGGITGYNGKKYLLVYFKWQTLYIIILFCVLRKI